MSFTVGENSEYGDSAMGVDMGMVGRKDSSKLRRPVEQKKPQLQLSKKARKALSSSTAAAAGTDGLATSLAFTDSKGIDLPPPPSTASKAAGAEGAGGGTSIFSSTSGFKV